MKNRLSLSLCFIFLSAVSVLGQSHVLQICNPSGMKRSELVSISWRNIQLKFPSIEKDNFKVIDLASQKELPFQLEYKGEKTVQNLLIQVDLFAKQTLKITLKKGKPTPLIAKTFGRYVPERKEDFAWENDKIAFRMYGQALEGSNENAYGMDVWAKRTDKLVINERYKRGEYHIDHGDGLDYYHVGLTLGAGNMAPISNDTIRYPQNYHSWKVLDNGPLRTTFQLGYDEWNVDGTMVASMKTISLDAGSQMNRIEVNYIYKTDKPLSVVAGIVKRPEPGASLLDDKTGIMAYWEPQHGDDGITGVGVIMQKDARMISTASQFLTQTSVISNKPIVYFAGATWNKAGFIINSDSWFDYLQNYKKCLQEPLTVSFK
ncbi:MAG: hypothetical protein JWN56_1035 [Sphingobacteriales bacterium]|nr:hypothetical protein [Sphingobacteriales bacterium]